jgi:hypothetical protein
MSLSRHHKKAVRVLPVPVGARMRVDSPRAMAGQPSRWGGVTVSKTARNQAAVMGWKTARASAGSGVSLVGEVERGGMVWWLDAWGGVPPPIFHFLDVSRLFCVVWRVMYPFKSMILKELGVKDGKTKDLGGVVVLVKLGEVTSAEAACVGFDSEKRRPISIIESWKGNYATIFTTLFGLVSIGCGDFDGVGGLTREFWVVFEENSLMC